MKNNRFERTVSILVKAYFDGELEHGDCSRCAVGNIVYAAGLPRVGDIQNTCSAWKWCFFTEVGVNTFEQRIKPFGDENFEIGLRAISKTEYTWQELARVESAFELAEGEYYSDEKMFNGLMAVVTVLAEIDGIDLDQTQHARSLFNPQVEAKQ